MGKYILGGIVFIIMGIGAWGTDSQSLSIPFFIIGVLCFVVPAIYNAKLERKRKAAHEAWLAKNNSATMQQVDRMSGIQFEQFCAALLIKYGFSVSYTKNSGDQGVDLVAQRDGIRYAIQCKRYNNKLGNKPVQEVYAGAKLYGCSVAIVMTNNYFTAGATEVARATGVKLWDRDKIMDLHFNQPSKTSGE